MDGSERATLEDMRDLLEGSVRTLRGVQMEYEHAPQKGSRAQREIKSHVRVQDAYSAASLSIGVAADHIEAVQELLHPDRYYPFGWASVARVVLEASGGAWWILDPDLTEAVLGRIARLEEQATELNVQPIRNRHGDLVAFGEPPPKISDRIQYLMGHVVSELGGKEEAGRDIGQTIYWDLSAVAHATIHGSLSRMRTVPDPSEEGMNRGYAELQINLVVNMMGPILLAFLLGSSAQVDLYGWDTEGHWGSWRGHATERTQRYLWQYREGS